MCVQTTFHSFLISSLLKCMSTFVCRQDFSELTFLSAKSGDLVMLSLCSTGKFRHLNYVFSKRPLTSRTLLDFLAILSNFTCLYANNRIAKILTSWPFHPSSSDILTVSSSLLFVSFSWLDIVKVAFFPCVSCALL